MKKIVLILVVIGLVMVGCGQANSDEFSTGEDVSTTPIPLDDYVQLQKVDWKTTDSGVIVIGLIANKSQTQVNQIALSAIVYSKAGAKIGTGNFFAPDTINPGKTIKFEMAIECDPSKANDVFASVENFFYAE